MRERRLGLAHAIFCSIPDIATLDARKRTPITHGRRSNFEVNRALGPALRDWYETLDQLDPGRIEWRFPDQVPDERRRNRYDIDLFNEWMERLPRPSTRWRLANRASSVGVSRAIRGRPGRDSSGC